MIVYYFVCNPSRWIYIKNKSNYKTNVTHNFYFQRTVSLKSAVSRTAWKMSKYGVISGPYLPVFSPDTGKYGPEITPYLDTFHAVK